VGTKKKETYQHRTPYLHEFREKSDAEIKLMLLDEMLKKDIHPYEVERKNETDESKNW